MAIDASIISGLRPVQFESPVNALAQMLRVQGMQQEAQLGQMKLDEYNRQASESRTLNQLYKEATGTDGKLDRNMLLGKVVSSGLGSRLPGMQKEFQALDETAAKTQKEQREAEKAQLDAARQKLALGAQILGSAKDQASYDAARQTAMNAGLDVSRMPPQFDAGFVQAKRTEGLTVLDQLDQQWKAKGFDLDLRKQGETERHNKATESAARDNANATRAVASATRDAARIQRDQATEMKLADDYRGQSKGFKEVSDAHKQLNATLDKATTSPAAALAGATKFMKLLDPGSVVRESELGMALAATGVLDRATNYVETLKYGKVLTPAQVADFKNITQQIYTAAQDGQRAIDANYRNQAKTYNLRPEMIVQDLGQNTKPAATTVRKFNPATGRIE